jgi:hypothetical protein
MKKHVVLAIAGLFTAVPTLACGPDFPNVLLDDRAGTLANLPEGSFAREIAALVPVPATRFKLNEAAEWIYTEHSATRESVERQWLGDRFDRAQAARAQVDATRAYAAGEGLPEDARRYLAGAAAFAHGDAAEAQHRFASVLELPQAQRAHYSIWALYMRGRSLAGNDPQQALTAFASVRERVAAGAEDPLGLALDSYGEEARIHLDSGEIPAAVRLYAEQAAQGSRFGEASLMRAAERVLRKRELLEGAVRDPLTRQLLAIYLRTRGEPDGRDAGDGDAAAAPNAPSASEAFLKAVEKQGIADIEGAAQLAAFAYQSGRYELAGKFAAKSHAGLAAWVRAKLALRAGDVNAAAAAYADAAKAFPVETPVKWGAPGSRDADEDYCRVQGEAGTLSLARGEYVAAMEHLYAAAPVYAADASFVAERVLSVDELRDFVVARAGNALPPPPANSPSEDHAGPARPLRALLARRLLRAERWDEAIGYFDDPALRTKAQAYADARRATTRGGSIEQAEAWYRAAKLAREDGLELIGYEFDPDMASWGGEFENVYNFGHAASRRGDEAARDAAPPALPFATGPVAGERARVAASQAVPDKRFHYRYVAADYAARGAERVPHRSQAYAALLCTATGFVLNDDLDLAHGYWRRYVKNGPHVEWAENFGTQCQAPDFPAAARRLHAERVATIKHYLRKSLPYAAGFAVLAMIASFLLWRRRRPKAG